MSISITPFILSKVKSYRLKIVITSVVLIIFSIGISMIGFPKLLRSLLKKNLVLTPETELRELWAKAPFAVTFKVYMFNVTNPHEVMEGMKPRVEQVGPYIFDEWKEKTDLQDDENLDSVSFDMRNTFIFRPDLTKVASDLTGNELITLPHLLIMGGLIAVQRDQKPLLKTAMKAMTSIFQPETPFLTASAMDILFHGIPIDCSSNDFAAKTLCSALETKKPIKVINDTFLTFSMLAGSNGTSMGRFQVNRGTKNIHQMGDIITFNDEVEVDEWGGECNIIKGTDSTIFAPFHAKEDILFAFAPDLCRSLGAKYLHPSSYKSVPTGFYSIDLGDLKNEPSQHCFCRDQDAEKCPPKGTLDLYPCTEAPLIISKPQFLDADEKLRRDVEGLNPNRNEHDIFLHLEMITSTPLSAAKRLQFAMDVEPVPDYPLMSKLPKVVLPLMWVEESVHLNSTYTRVFKALYIVLNVNSIIKYAAIMIGILGLILVALQFYNEKNSNPIQIQSTQHQQQSPISTLSKSLSKVVPGDVLQNEMGISKEKEEDTMKY